MFIRLMRFLRGYRKGVIGSLAFAILAMVATVTIPWLTGYAIDGIQNKDWDAVKLAAAGVLVAAIFRVALSVGRRLVSGRVSLGVEFDLRNKMYEHLQELELGFFDRNQTGQLMSRATVDLQAVRFFLGYGLIFIVQGLLTILLAAAAMLLKEPSLALIALAPVPFVVFSSMRYGRQARPMLQEVQQRVAELTADMEENISGVRIVKAFGAEEQQLGRVRRSVGRVFSQSVAATVLRAKYNPLLGFLPSLGLAAIMLVGGRAVIEGQMSLGDFTAFYAYMLMLVGPMRQLGMALAMAQRATASGNRVFQILDQEPEIVSPPGAPLLPPGAGEVTFKNVSFGYTAGDPVLRNLDLTIAAGTTVALVGPNGSGKSTLAALLPRLYDVQSGAVLIDGADIRSVDLHDLRRAIAVVSDDPFLFSASVRENISYAHPEATLDDVKRVAEIARAAEFIEELPNGYDTQIGELGLNLSAGQRQRIALARALLADPRILILDDATSSVDASTEKAIKTALVRVGVGHDSSQNGRARRTTFLIAHRLATLALADEVVVLERGEIVARGTHSELMETNALYADIVARGLPDQVFLNRPSIETEELT